MKSLILTLLLTAGGVLLLFGVSLSQSPPQFGPPQNLGPKINSSFYESDPFWDGPRKRLYFVSARDGGEDIWYSDWTDTGWTDPQAVGGGINTGEIEHSPSVTPNGQQLFFVTFARPGAQNPWDFWVSAWDSNLNDWGAPVELPCPVNTPGTEFSGKIAPDGKTLYFFSTHGDCNPRLSGLMSSVFDSASGWSLPQDLGPNVNTGNGAQYPSVTSDSKWLYFDRDASEGDGISIFVSPWTGTIWGPAFDLRPQIGERAVTPAVVPSGDSLFFSSSLLSGFGGRDIYLMELILTSVEEEKEANLPKDFQLHQNYPNPFNAQTQIPLFVSKSVNDEVNLTVYNVLGQPIRRLLGNEPAMGKTQVLWDGRDNSGEEVSSGIYLYELRVGSERIVKKAVLIR